MTGGFLITGIFSDIASDLGNIMIGITMHLS
jgi:hypothetical protein